MHLPDERVRAYALGEDSDPNNRKTEAHLLCCETCRRKVQLIRQEVVSLTDALPPIEPSRATWGAVKRSLSLNPVDWRLRRAVAAAAVIIAALGSWGSWQQRANSVLLQDQRVVASWLARPDAAVLPLTDRAKRLKGRLILAADHTALFVLAPPPPGQRYHVWVSTKSNWKFGDPVRLVHTSTDGVFQVGIGNTDYLCVSLDREVEPVQLTPANVVGLLFL